MGRMNIKREATWMFVPWLAMAPFFVREKGAIASIAIGMGYGWGAG